MTAKNMVVWDAFLIDRIGKVISVNARGRVLDERWEVLKLQCV